MKYIGEMMEKKTLLLEDKSIFTEKETCELLRISPVTIWRERKRGKISFRRVASKIVYLREDIELYLTTNKREAFGNK